MAQVSLNITVDTNDFRYSLWNAQAAIRELNGTPTPLHEVMAHAGLWSRATRR